MTASQQSTELKGPTWHIDQNVELRIDPHYHANQINYINAAVLKGSSTRFSNISPNDLSTAEKECLIFEELEECEGLTEKIDQSQLINMPAGYFARFATGSESGVIHSAPVETSDRIWIGFTPLDCNDIVSPWCTADAWRNIIGLRINQAHENFEILPMGDSHPQLA